MRKAATLFHGCSTAPPTHRLSNVETAHAMAEFASREDRIDTCDRPATHRRQATRISSGPQARKTLDYQGFSDRGDRI